MAAITAPASSLSSFTITINSLANVTFVASSAVDLSGVDALDVIVQLEVTPGTVSGNKQMRVYVQTSVDGSDYSTGPTSGTTTTDEPLLVSLGVLPLPTNSTLQRKHFSLIAALGFIPPYIKLILFNDSGATLAGSGNAAKYATVTGLST